MASQLDGAGQIKLATLDEAGILAQRLHGIVEHYAMAVRQQQSTSMFRQQLVRAATPLSTMLKPQFSVMADSVASFLLVASRGGGEQAKVRALREAMASIRAQLEIAVTKVKEKHSVAAGESHAD